MGDSLKKSIDDGYDAVERFVDGVGSVLGVSTTIDQPKVAIVDGAKSIGGKAKAQIAPAPKPMLALGTGAAPKFEIKPGTDVSTGSKVWIVTNGVSSAVCKSAERAIEVLAILQKAGA